MKRSGTLLPRTGQDSGHAQAATTSHRPKSQQGQFAVIYNKQRGLLTTPVASACPTIPQGSDPLPAARSAAPRPSTSSAAQARHGRAQVTIQASSGEHSGPLPGKQKSSQVSSFTCPDPSTPVLYARPAEGVN
ncbi:hypothetical protein NDU88_002564 [Pleurodeles waltl]|uniref:Uncharacterized protein n=1 Tax=Pleurodeles waltl TaxID=8319 RepID=A0AAV7KSH7_PLEWA|nr:hypothetical protein NDU88_002564 [Pleurodeles waltl]